MICAFGTELSDAKTLQVFDRYVYSISLDGFVAGGKSEMREGVNKLCEQARDGYSFVLVQSKLLR